MNNYFHFRAPASASRSTALDRSGLLGAADFLDPLSEDTPKASAVWSLRVDAGRGAAYLKSLVYPGFYFFHTLNTSRFGGAYFGDGGRNDDIGFML